MGPSSEIWEMDPDCARVLFTSWVSGKVEIVQLRNALSECMLGTRRKFASVELSQCALRHVRVHEIQPPLAPDEVYVGNGVENSEYFTASQWCNPFQDMDFYWDEEETQQVSFCEYLDSRMDYEDWLYPLVGKVLVCTCTEPQCHATHLVSAVNELTEQLRAQNTTENLVGTEVDDGEDILGSGDGDPEWDTPTGTTKQALWSANETVGKPPTRVSQKPSWPSSWHWLLAKVRMAQTLLFWEIFAGCGELTKQFSAEGWETAPPIDILFDESWDVFNAEFLGMLLGILYERRVKLLHLGTPCSSFSMAFNRFKKWAIRSAKFPGGLPGLNAKQQHMVEIGNLLVHVGISLLKAQEAMGMLWTWEQPATSLQLLYKPLYDIFEMYAVCFVVSHLCAYGAPWLKPTMVISNSLLIETLNKLCPGCLEHIRIEGKAPCGANWSKIASAYWPEWAMDFAQHFRSVRGQPREAPPSRQAGWLAPSRTSVLDAVKETGYIPSGGRSLQSVATRISALTQPTGRSLQQMLPDGLSEETHLKLALSACHPFQRPSSLEPYIAMSLGSQRSGKHVTSHRYATLEGIEALAKALAEEEEFFRTQIHPELLPIVGRRSMCLARELQYLCMTDDVTCISDYAVGKPMLGWTRRAYGQRYKVTNPTMSIKELKEYCRENNTKMILRTQRSDDEDLNLAVDEKVAEEVEIDALQGPYFSLEEVPGDEEPMVVPRHGIWEMHGGQEQETCRLIDDMLISKHNATAGSEYTHVPADVDKVVGLSRAAQEAFPEEGLSCFASDFRKAYKQDSLSPRQMRQAIIAVWSAAMAATVFYVPRTQLFGSRVSPVNFSRLPIWTYKVMAVLFCVAMLSCVDDVICTERMSTIQSAYRCWRRLCDLLGWDVPDSKSPPPARALRVLGIWLDLSATPFGPFVVYITPDRLQKLIILIEEILKAGRLPGTVAATLFGQLGWTCSTSHGRAGRARLRPINRRTGELRTGLNVQLRLSLEWWKRYLVECKPRAFSQNVQSARHVVSYSDGEGAEGGVGAALWFAPDTPPVAGFLYVPLEVRLLWREQRERVFRDIFELEAIAPFLILHHWHKLMKDAVWTHYIDNDGALAALIRGSSSIEAGDIVVGETWSLCARHRIAPWYERVASSSNPLDGLSRGRREGPWLSVQTFSIPETLLASLRAAGVGPRSSGSSLSLAS